MSNDMKWIERKSIAPIEPATGAVSDTLNVEDKVKNAPSINLVTQMTGIPQDGVIAFDGDVIPEGYEEVHIGYSTEETLTGETWINGKPIYRKVIQLSTPTTNTNGTTAWSSPQLILENVDFVFLKNSFVVKPTVDGNSIFDEIIPAPFYNQTGMVIVALRKTNGNTVDCVLGNSITSYSNIPIYLICEYTKTTD